MLCVCSPSSDSSSPAAAYKQADGRKIDGKRVVVDVERGRTVKSWQPRRLGGGLGGTRRGGPNDNIKYSGRIDERCVCLTSTVCINST